MFCAGRNILEWEMSSGMSKNMAFSSLPADGSLGVGLHPPQPAVAPHMTLLPDPDLTLTPEKVREAGDESGQPSHGPTVTATLHEEVGHLDPQLDLTLSPVSLRKGLCDNEPVVPGILRKKKKRKGGGAGGISSTETRQVRFAIENSPASARGLEKPLNDTETAKATPSPIFFNEQQRKSRGEVSAPDKSRGKGQSTWASRPTRPLHREPSGAAAPDTLMVPAYNSTLSLSQRLRDVMRDDFDAGAAAEELILRSEVVRQEISEKAARGVNVPRNCTLYSSLPSLSDPPTPPLLVRHTYRHNLRKVRSTWVMYLEEIICSVDAHLPNL
uniref:Protein phosphatase 1 regulatory subunit 35 C-terminal domain-containing protein n=1 Tax=Eptatretus burgeri TaxID=7764 RepID=A0A8C4X1K4_EPTBU